MPDSKMNDLFMFMTDQDDQEMKGESSLQVAKSNSQETMMGDFRSADYRYYSNFFDVTEFDFNIELDDSDQSAGGNSYGAHGDWYMYKDPVQAFANKQDSQRNNPYKLKKVTGTFGKVVDAVSPILFQNCCLKLPFKRAVLVKRAFTGGSAPAGDSSALAYLQLKMEDITVTSVSWNDGDVVEEKVRFKCEHLEINYRKQDNNGKLERQMQLLKWDWATSGKKA
jgi:type VI protein secretion system component Hcp